MQGRSLQQQGEESHKAFEKLTAEKKALDNELSILLTSSEPKLPQDILEFIGKRGPTQEAEERLTLLRQRANYAAKMLSSVSLALMNLHSKVSSADPYRMMSPDFHLSEYYKSEGSLVFSEDQLSKLLLILTKHLSMLSVVSAQRRASSASLVHVK